MHRIGGWIFVGFWLFVEPGLAHAGKGAAARPGGRVGTSAASVRARRLFEQEKYQEAREAYRGLYRETNNPLHLAYVGLCDARLGYLPRALQALRRALEQVRKLPSSHPWRKHEPEIARHVEKVGRVAERRQKAVELYRRGLLLAGEGEYLEALKFYWKAYGLYRSPKLLASIAGLYEKLGQFVRAMKLFKQALSEVEALPAGHLWADLREHAMKDVQRILTEVARLRVVVSVPGAKVLVGGRVTRMAPLDETFYFNPGKVSVVVTKKGFYPDEKSIRLQPGRLATVEVSTLVKIKAKVVVKVKVKRELPIWRRWWFWTAVGTVVSGTALGLGLWFGRKEVDQTVEAHGDPTLSVGGMPVRW